MNPDACVHCGAPNPPPPGRSTVPHVDGCLPGVSWEKRRRDGTAWGAWTAIPAQDAYHFSRQRDVQVRAAPEAW